VKAALTAGSTFAGGVILGFLAGLYVADRTKAALWAVAGLLTGAVFGGYAAVRQLLQAGK
jgi:prolipoprotein diacylglyceryltransferase